MKELIALIKLHCEAGTILEHMDMFAIAEIALNNPHLEISKTVLNEFKYDCEDFPYKKGTTRPEGWVRKGVFSFEDFPSEDFNNPNGDFDNQQSTNSIDTRMRRVLSLDDYTPPAQNTD